MGKWKTTLPIVLSLAIAISGSIFIYRWINARTAPAEVVQVQAEAVPVAVAKVDLPWGTQIKPEMITTASYLKESLPPGHFSKVDALNGRVVISPLKRGDPVSEHRLAPTEVKTGGVSAILKKGKRAVSVKGDKVAGISGFIKPGNHVDVLVTINDPKTKQEKTKIVLEKLPVLATGTQIENNGKGDPSPVDVYTLEVTPEEAEKLALASTKGRLQFALRNVTDTEGVITKGATISQTLTSLTKPSLKERKNGSKKRVKKWKPRRRTVTVEIIKGSEVIRKKYKL